MFTKLIVIASTFFCSAVASAQPHTFAPDNDLWKEDCIACKSNTMTQETFNTIVEAGRKAFAADARARGEKLVINALWNDSTVNANCMRSGGQVTVNMYGGLARRPEVNFSGFAIVLAHELGHAYGGTPYVQPANQMAAEGQADYFATLDAYRRMFEISPLLQKEPVDVGSFVKEVCTVSSSVMAEESPRVDERCVHSLMGGKGLAELLAALSRDTVPQFETPDPLIVSRTELSYPQTTQCRLDTYVAGTLGRARPKCWFKN